MLRYASGEAARLSIGREGFDFPTERQSIAGWRDPALLLFLALALDVGAVGALVGLNVLELAGLVAHGVELGALRAAMRGPLGHELPLLVAGMSSTSEVYGAIGRLAIRCDRPWRALGIDGRRSSH